LKHNPFKIGDAEFTLEQRKSPKEVIFLFILFCFFVY